MKFTIGAVVSNWLMYSNMRESFLEAGFYGDCNFIVADNTDGNKYDMFSGGNFILSQSVSDYVILVHQDILATFDKRSDLEDRIAELDAKDENWAVAGNAGTNAENGWFVRITDPYGKDCRQGTFPTRVTMLDGNFLLIKRNSLVAFSNDLTGFHYYGWDICLNADIRGYSAYVIDWHLKHLGSGNVDKEFFACKERFENKWNAAFRDRTIGAWDHDRVTLRKDAGKQ